MGRPHRYQTLHWFKTRIQRFLLPLLLGLFVTIAVLGVWQQLLIEENWHIEQLVQQQVSLIQVELEKDLTAHVSTLERMAKRWDAGEGTSKTVWETAAASVIDDFPGLQAIAWVDSSLQVQWVAPQAADERFQKLDFRQASPLRSTLDEVRNLRQSRLTPTSLSINGESERGFLAAIPLFVKPQINGAGQERFDGFILGLLSSQTLFDNTLHPASQYQVRISDDTGLIYQQGEILPSSLSKTVTLQVYEQAWQVRVALTPFMQERSRVSSFVLWGGLAGAWILALVAYLGQQARRQSRRTRSINRQLQDEIIHRQQVEANLREIAEVLENAVSGISKLDAQGRYLYVNKAYADITGYHPQEMIGMSWQQTIHPDDLKLLSSVYQQMLQDGKVEVEAKGIRKDSSVFYKQIVMIAICNEQQQFVGHYCFIKDISDRKQTELALQNSQARFAGILEIARDAIISVNAEQQIILFNKGAERIFGYTAAEVLDQPLTLLIPDRFAQAHCHHVNQYAHSEGQAQQMTQRGAIVGRRKDGTEFPAEASISKLNLNGEITFTTFLRDISERVQLEAERQQSEQALRESEARFQSFMFHSPALAWITDAEGKISYLNQAYLCTFQLFDEDFVGKSIFDLFPADIAQSLLDNIQTVARTQQVLEVTEIAPRRDGTMGTFLVYKFPIPNSLGQMLIGGVAIDITQQHQTEEALRQSEATKQAIIQAIPDLLIQMRADGRYVEFISNSHFNIINPAQRRENTTLYDVLPPELAQLRMQHMQKALQSATIEVYEHEIWIEGKQCYEEVRIVPLFNNEVLVMVRDITDRKRAEDDLLHQKEMFQAIITNIPVMIALFHSDGRIEFVNPELEHVLGWSLEDWQHKNVLALCYPDATYCQSVKDFMLAATGKWQDMMTLTASGRSLETSWANVRLSSGKFLGIGQDISERAQRDAERKRKELALQQAMEAAEAANMAKSMFLANMSHELRTPLNVILGFAQVMGHDSSLTPTQRDDLQTIRRSGDHLLSLINDVLDLSKIEAGHYTLEESGFDLISLLHTLRSMMAERAKAKRLQLTFEIAAEVPQFVIADEQKLRQILLNLLSNAIKFTKQGRVTLRVSSRDSSAKNCLVPHPSQTDDFPNHLISSASCTLQFEVVDTGVGIAETEQEGIFDAFVQAEAGRKSMGGTGLGLTISRKLLELMSGHISVTSTPGVGSTFTMTVPVCPTSSVEGQIEQQERTIIGLVPKQSHHRILVVDDQQENRRLMVRLLARLGLEVREASNGQEAIAVWRQWRPDLTWMDIRMPILDGYEATRRIRAMEQGSASIIIALTAQASQSDRALALAAGCDDYISKPFREETLFLKMAEYLGLEYLYADASDLSTASSIAPLDTSAHSLSSFDPSLLDRVPADWIETLENLAICGDDRAIADLANQLAPEFDALKTQLLDLTNQFEFEQIIALIHRNSSS